MTFCGEVRSHDTSVTLLKLLRQPKQPPLVYPKGMSETYKAKHWLISVPFVALHLGCIAVFFVDFQPIWLIFAIGYYLIRMFGITAGYHRYFAHKSFKTSRAFQFILALLGTLALQKGVIWWAGHHRTHHKYSGTEKDIHAPEIKGFWWSHVGWILSPKYFATPWENMKDFAKYPEIRFLNDYSILIGVIPGLALLFFFGLPAFVWGFLVSTMFLYHGTFVINSLAHKFGKRRFETSDDSRNSLILALITLGEGWHNNHHYFQNSARQGFYWWEIDVSYYVLKGLAALGIVWGIKEPPARVYEEAAKQKDVRRSAGTFLTRKLPGTLP